MAGAILRKVLSVVSSYLTPYWFQANWSASGTVADAPSGRSAPASRFTVENVTSAA